MNRTNLIFLSLAVLVSMLFAACFGSGTTGETWLVVAGGDTLTVAEVGQAWDRLGPDNREIFTTKDNPVGEFIVALARRIILEDEMTDEGYLSDEGLLGRREAWLRFTTVGLAYAYFNDRALGDVTEEDIDFYMEHIGPVVWYTTKPDTPEEESVGPAHLPEIPFELVLMLDGLEVHDTAVDSIGFAVRLDSIVVTDSALVAETVADSVASRQFAASRLAQGRNRRWLDGIRDSILVDDSVIIDSTAVQALIAHYSDTLGIDPEAVVVSTGLEEWTTQELVYYIDFLGTRMYSQPADSTWMDYFVHNLITHSVMIGIMAEEDPGIADSLAEEADAYIFDLASEWMYNDMVGSVVEVTEEDVLEQFESIGEPPVVEEMRVFRMVTVPDSLMADYRLALGDGTLDEFLSGLSGLGYLSGDPSDLQVTRPVMESEVPGAFGPELFEIDPADSNWMVPAQIADHPQYIVVKLLEVIPERPATLEDVRYEMEMAAQSRLEENATIQWMQQLEEKYGLEINEEALDGLPSDPGLWSEL